MSTLFHSARKLDARGQVDDFWMLVEGDSISSTGSGTERPAAQATVDLTGLRLVPGFIDLHAHGGGGHSFDDGPDRIRAALATHRAHGTTRSVISFVTATVEDLRTSLDAVAGLAGEDPLILGSHLEGPFLSPGRRGGHDPRFLRHPEPVVLDGLVAAARGTLRQVTLAPELPGALAAIDSLVASGVTVAVGHTEADARLTRTAFDRGARLLTHAFNAMPGIRHREPGPVVAAFEDERVVLELIVDGTHVHPSIARLAFAQAPGRIAIVTDAMAAAGAGDGDYRVGSMDVTVRDGLAVLRGTSTIAGSTLLQDSALRAAMHDALVAPADAVAALTLTPARVLGLGHRHGLLSPGYAADAVVLDEAWRVTGVWANGTMLRTPSSHAF